MNDNCVLLLIIVKFRKALTMTKQRSGYMEREFGISIQHDPNAPLNVSDLMGIAARRNPKRAQLLVSNILGKYIPQDPRLVAYTGRLLGAMVDSVLFGNYDRESFRPHLQQIKENIYKNSTVDDLVELPTLRELDDDRCTVIGFAETATSLGFLVSEYLDSWYIHTTRITDGAVYLNFQEEHSHASSHNVMVPQEHIANLENKNPLVLVDDEISTGNTCINIIRELHARSPREHYIVASLIDCRRKEDIANFIQFSEELGVRVDFVSLASGVVDVPFEAVENVMSHEPFNNSTKNLLSKTIDFYDENLSFNYIDASEVALGSMHLRFGGTAKTHMPSMSEHVACKLHNIIGDNESTVLVLGQEEFLSLPLMIAEELSQVKSQVLFGSTARSPIHVLHTNGEYPIEDGLSFNKMVMGEVEKRFSYNMRQNGKSFDHIVLILEPGQELCDVSGVDGLKEVILRVLPESELTIVKTF